MNKKILIISIIVVAILLVVGLVLLMVIIKLNSNNQPNFEEQCVFNTNCQEGFSCWHQIPRGPFDGIPGSKENPGECWDNETIQMIV